MENVVHKEKVEKYTKRLCPNAPLFPAKDDISKGEEVYYWPLKDMIEQQVPPGIEMETFDRNPPEYLDFVNLFRELKSGDGKMKSNRKITQTAEILKGTSYDLIKHCLKEPSYTGYTNA